MTKTDNKTLTAADFYGFRLLIRARDYNIVMKLKKLTQKYTVDQWVKVEGGRLDWVCRNQKTIRAEKYQGLMDAAHVNDVVDVGMKVGLILPATIYGSP